MLLALAAAIPILILLATQLRQDDTWLLASVPVGEYQGCQVFTLPMYEHVHCRGRGQAEGPDYWRALFTRIYVREQRRTGVMTCYIC